jgi:hypothetical protein
MPTLTNSPQDVTVIEAEARKSFAFGIWLKNSNGDAVDISNSQTSFTLGKYDKYGVATVLVSKDFNVVAPSLGYMTVFVDADQLNYKPDTYYFTVTLRIQGYSVVLMKGDFALQQNMEFDSINHDYVATNPAQSVEVTLREALNVHVMLSALLPPNLVIPTDASDLAVAGYVSNPASATRAQLDLVYVDNTELTNGLATKPNTSTVVLKSQYTAKGAILVGTGVSTPSTLPLGSQDQVLVVDTSLAGGVKWAALTAAQIPALDATKITTGTFALARIPIMDAAHIPALDTSKITTGVFAQARMPATTVKAMLDPNYLGPGPSKVRFWNGTSFDALSSTAYQWLGVWKPWGTRVVEMVWAGTDWKILTHTGEEGFGGKIDLTPYLANSWQAYTLRNGMAPRRWAPPRAQKLPSGIVVLSGLIGYGTSTLDSIIGVLPVGYRPDMPMIFPINNGDTAKTVVIYPDGTIKARNGWVANTYISLDGIAFPAAGVATWTDFTAGAFKNGWVDYYPTDPQWGHAGYWKDPYGFVWTRGMIRGGTTTTGDLPMVSLPSSVYGSHLQSHVNVACADAFGYVSVFPNGDICWKLNSTSNAWISLAGICIVTPDALTQPWWNFGLVNGWVRYSTSFPLPALLTREDGLTMSKGLVAGGTVNAKIFNTSGTGQPEGEIILASVSNALWNRVDIYAKDQGQDDRGGFIQINNNGNTWQSLDNKIWMVGD